MNFNKYQHVDKLDSRECDGIMDGVCHVFYKIDGTNGSIWLDDEGIIQCGSRNRQLTEDNDNQGFWAWVNGVGYESLNEFFTEHVDITLFGEWLVPHSLKTYRTDAWREFYVFDAVETIDTVEYVDYETYVPMLEECGINYIPELAQITNPTSEDLYRFLEKSGQYLIEDGKGKGEGIVIKNYEYRNCFGRQTWAKIVTNEFKEKHHKEMGAPKVNNTDIVEIKAVRDFLTDEFIMKEKAKIMSENDGYWENKFLPRLFGVVQHEFVRDHIHSILKKYKQPTISFKTLNAMVIRKIKETLQP